MLDTLTKRTANPIVQAVLLIFAAVLIMLAGKAVGAIGLIKVGQTFPWMSAAAFLLFYAIVNSVYRFSPDRPKNYVLWSIVAFILLAAGNSAAAWLLSGLSIDQAGFYRWIYFTFFIGMLVFLSIVGMIQFLIGIMNEEERRMKQGEQMFGARQRRKKR